jgi:hypothetical protein
VSAPGLVVQANGLPLYGLTTMRAATIAAGGTFPQWPAGRSDDHLFSLGRRVVDRLRARRVGVEGPVDLRFTRHVLVGTITARVGQAFRTPEYLVEIVSVQPYSALCRFTRFPSLTGPSAAVVPFTPARSGYGVIPDGGFTPTPTPSLHGMQRAFDPTDQGIGWAFGRSWTLQVWLPILDAAATPVDLRIVESRPAGDLRTVLVAHDILVEEQAPSPPPVTLQPPPDVPGRRF